MHELSVCMALLDQVHSIAQDHGAIEVERILLQVGPLSGVEPSLLESAYPLAAAGTIAEFAVLDIELTEVIVRCIACGVETQVEANRLICGCCGGFRTRVIRGEEMLLAKLELMIPDKPEGG